MNKGEKERAYLPALIIVLVLCSFTVFAYFLANSTVRSRQSRLFDLRVQQAAGNFKSRMIDYSQILKACQGLFYASDTVTAADWKTFVHRLNVSENYPGVQAIAFAKFLPKDRSQDFERTFK